MATPSDAQDKGHQKGTGGKTPTDMARGGRKDTHPGDVRLQATRPPRFFSLLICSLASQPSSRIAAHGSAEAGLLKVIELGFGLSPSD